jgi:hypothetical protein
MPSAQALLRFSRGLAATYGIGLPLGETARRWGKIDYWPAFLDDWIIGAFLLIAVWATRPARPVLGGGAVLAAAWGFTCGLGYASVFGHLRTLDQPEVGPLPHVVIAGIIGVGWLGVIAALLATVVASEHVETTHDT